jgi:DNA polymerase-3 subunit epsilon
LLGSAPRLAPELEERLQRLSELAPPPTLTRHRESRYVTVAVESTGLDRRRDRLRAIGAVAVDRGLINLAHCFEVELRQPASSSRDERHVQRNDEQSADEDPAEALLRFLEFVGHCPLVAFRSEFDRATIDRALKEHLGTISQSAWLDLAKLLPALYPLSENRTTDDWLAAMNIRAVARHDALADALATAQMLQVCLHQAETQDMTCPAQLLEVQKSRRTPGKR